ncbi:MAG TPA: nitrilase-related carbon-nitrogen hydrolase, partial [Myxococcales bacterium]|nr:nitrilase-related carbon-nitrogen hydrolase [Myxococcales bacterium]
MKIALAQIDTIVGAFAENAAAIVRQSREAAGAGARLVLFPELTLCGYPPKDLLGLREFIQRQLAALDKLAADPVFARVPALVGFAEPHRGEGAGLFNACALLRDGKIAAVARKSLLPTYDVFDEARYFDPSPAVTVVEIAGTRVGLSICEDLWNDKLFWQEPRYLRDPVEELARQGAQVLVNLSASPYALGKTQVRRDMVAAAARRHRMPIALCNLVGGNDSLVFDGHSLAVSAAGDILVEAPGFDERLVLAELSPKAL